MSDTTFSVPRAQFAEQLQIVARGLSSKSIIPTIGGILMEIHQGEITLTATDLETQISASMSSLESDTPTTKMLLPAQIAEIAKALPGDDVTLAVDENSVTITAGAAGESNVKLLTLCPDGFPIFGQRDSKSDEETAFAISVFEFKKVLRQVIFAVSTDMNRLKFTHVYMELAGNTLQLAASDTYRLADTSCPVERLSGSNDIKMLVPARPLHEFLRIAQKLTDDLVINVTCKGNNISIKTEAIKIATRLGSEEYPDIRKIFPTTFEGAITLNASAFRQALERAMILTEKSGTSAVDFSTEDPSLVGTDMSISVVSTYGSLKERINVEYNGSGFRATLNARYLHEWLKNCKGDTVQIQHNGPNQPCVALDTTAPGYKYLVLPIKRGDA